MVAGRIDDLDGDAAERVTEGAEALSAELDRVLDDAEAGLSEPLAVAVEEWRNRVATAAEYGGQAVRLADRALSPDL